MGIAKILFKFPSPGDDVGEFIDFCESDGKDLLDLPCHVGILTGGGVEEALWPVVTVSDLSRYDTIKHKIIALELPDLATADSWAKNQLGVPYSFKSCAEAEYFALTGNIISIRQPGTDCSQLAANYCRFGGLSILHEIQAEMIRPSDLWLALIAKGGIANN